MPCPVPAPGEATSHPVPRQPPPQPLPSHHLPSILFTAARQFFEKLKLGHVTCLVSLATLRVKPKRLIDPKGPHRPACDSWFPPLGITFKPPSPAFQRRASAIPSPLSHSACAFLSGAAMPLLLVIPASAQISFSEEPCPAPLSLPRLTLSDCISNVALWLPHCYLVTAVCLLEGLLPPLVPTGVPGT